MPSNTKVQRAAKKPPKVAAKPAASCCRAAATWWCQTPQFPSVSVRRQPRLSLLSAVYLRQRRQLSRSASCRPTTNTSRASLQEKFLHSACARGRYMMGPPSCTAADHGSKTPGGLPCGRLTWDPVSLALSGVGITCRPLHDLSLGDARGAVICQVWRASTVGNM